MKKIYSLLLIAGSLASTSVFSQADRQNSTQSISSVEKKEILSKVIAEKRGSLPQLRAIVCDSLTVDTVAGNGFNGNMFDIIVANSCYLETFSVSMDAGTWNIAIFYKAGTFVGSETSSAGWIFLDSAQVTSTFTGAGVFNKVPVSLNFNLTSGNTYAFYVTGTAAASPMNYTNGTTVGTAAASDTYITVNEGNGGAYPFNVINSPRVFNGKVHHCVNTVDVSNESSLPSFEIYPNPADNSVTVDLSIYNGSKVNLSVINAFGQRVQTTFLVANGITTLNLEDYASGLYIVQVEMNGKISNTKLTIK